MTRVCFPATSTLYDARGVLFSCCMTFACLRLIQTSTYLQYLGVSSRIGHRQIAIFSSSPLLSNATRDHNIALGCYVIMILRAARPITQAAIATACARPRLVWLNDIMQLSPFIRSSRQQSRCSLRNCFDERHCRHQLENNPRNSFPDSQTPANCDQYLVSLQC